MNKHKRVFIAYLFLAIVASIVSHAQDKDTASLIQRLEHKDIHVQNKAYNSLVEIGEAAVPVLIAELNHENTSVCKRWQVVTILHKIRRRVPHNKDIVRALINALNDDDYSVRYAVTGGFFPDLELPPELVSGLVQLLYYESPLYSYTLASDLLLLGREGKGNPQGKAALIEALHSSEWSLRFGASIAYGYTLRLPPTQHLFQTGPRLPGDKVRISTPEKLPPETTQAVISTLVEGLTHPDWKTQEHAILALRSLHYVADEAAKALKGLPPFSIISQTISDGDEVRGDALNSLNTDGITFTFNRSLPGAGGWITIKPVDGEPLKWINERSSHSITITPPEGKELVMGRGQHYTIQLRDVRDILGNQVDADIEFSTEVPLRRAP